MRLSECEQNRIRYVSNLYLSLAKHLNPILHLMVHVQDLSERRQRAITVLGEEPASARVQGARHTTKTSCKTAQRVNPAMQSQGLPGADAVQKGVPAGGVCRVCDKTVSGEAAPQILVLALTIAPNPKHSTASRLRWDRQP